MKGKTWLIGLAILMLILTLVAVIGKKKGFIGSDSAVDIVASAVEKRSLVETVTANGKIYPEIEVKISADVSGEVIELDIEEGDSVKEGKLLLRINPDIYESAVTRSEALLNQMKANEASFKAQLTQVNAQYQQSISSYDRNFKLHAQDVISESEFESITASHQTAIANKEAGEQNAMAAKYNVQSSVATVKEARDNLKKTRIYAPVSGIISKLNIEKGERVLGTIQMQGTEVLRIADLNNMEARVDVSENDILRVSLGDEVQVEVDAYLDKKFKGIVTQIAHSPNQDLMGNSDQVTNFQVNIRLLRSSYKDLIQPEKGHRYPFRPGMSTTVNIETEKAEGVLTVPIQAVTTRSGEKDKKNSDESDDSEKENGVEGIKGNSEEEDFKEMVFVVEDGEVKLVEVVTGIQNDSYIQIISGLSENQKVVTAPFKAISKTLDDGDKVNEVKEEDLFSKTKKKGK